MKRLLPPCPTTNSTTTLVSSLLFYLIRTGSRKRSVFVCLFASLRTESSQDVG